ncbi:MAG: hypothetical protein HYV07_26310 [Deltaproteobacteria bacterium]|nr:hypothetical protein [Deltaproteobacteria bacterium]
MWVFVALQVLATPVTLEQPTVSFSIGKDRITIAAMAERLDVARGRLSLEDNPHVPARVERGVSSVEARIDFGRAVGAVDAKGDAVMRRAAKLVGADGAVQSFELQLTIDLLGLGDERPSVRLANAILTREDGVSAQLASNRAPITWATPSARLLTRKDGTGIVELRAPLSPEYFIEDSVAPVELQHAKLKADLRAVVAGERWSSKSIEIAWEKVGESYVGRFKAPEANGDKLLRLRFGSLDGLSLPLVADPKDETASLGARSFEGG